MLQKCSSKCEILLINTVKSSLGNGEVTEHDVGFALKI